MCTHTQTHNVSLGYTCCTIIWTEGEMWEEAEGEEEDGFLSIMKLIDCQDPETKYECLA